MVNDGGKDSKGLIPYTVDEWAKIKWKDGSARFPDGVVTYSAQTKAKLKLGDTITFQDADYRTYSFEMQNSL